MKNKIDYVAELKSFLEDNEKNETKEKIKPKQKIKSKKAEKKKNIHKDHRKRLDKRAEQGMESLADHEMLELMLFAVIPAKNTNDIAHALIARFGSLRGVLSADPKELQNVSGVGYRTAQFLSQLNGFIGGYLRSKKPNPILETDKDISKYVSTFFIGKEVECAFVFFLDKNKKVKGYEKLSEGISDETYIYAEAVAKKAAINGCNMVIIAHNHPSGTEKPSEADIVISRKTQRALEAVGITLWDSVIVTDDKCYSMKKNGDLSKIKFLF